MHDHKHINMIHEHIGVIPDYPEHVIQLCSGLSVALEIRAEDAVETFRQTAGPWDVEMVGLTLVYIYILKRLLRFLNLKTLSSIRIRKYLSAYLFISTHCFVNI